MRNSFIQEVLKSIQTLWHFKYSLHIFFSNSDVTGSSERAYFFTLDLNSNDLVTSTIMKP